MSLPRFRVCSDQPYQEQHDIGKQVARIEEVDECLESYPTRVWKARIEEVEHNHVSINYILKQCDDKLCSRKDHTDLLDLIVIIVSSVLNDVTIWIVYDTGVETGLVYYAYIQ